MPAALNVDGFAVGEALFIKRLFRVVVVAAGYAPRGGALKGVALAEHLA